MAYKIFGSIERHDSRGDVIGCADYVLGTGYDKDMKEVPILEEYRNGYGGEMWIADFEEEANELRVKMLESLERELSTNWINPTECSATVRIEEVEE